ncbi:unnamed protein product [Somion occarium]
MCNLHTEGTKYGCGHYVITRKVSKIDCNNPYCALSRAHRNPCHGCMHDHYYGPDASETITARTSEFCDECHAYWKVGAGRGRGR